MTLLPTHKSEIAVYDGPVVPPDEETVCAHPACGERRGLEPHHVVRRSETGGPAEWVSIRGIVLYNVRRLCWQHHRMVTGGIGGHRAWIRYLEGEGWVWYAPAPVASARPGFAPPVVDKIGQVWFEVGPLKVV